MGRQRDRRILTPAPPSRWRRLLVPGAMTLLMLALLVALGTWQVYRLAWKQGILAEIAAAEAGPAEPLGAAARPYQKVSVQGRFRDDLAATYGAEVRQTRAGPEMGAQLVVPLLRDGAPPLLVDRGWVPMPRRPLPAEPVGPATVTGYVHPADRAGLFSAPDDPATRAFYTLDPAAIGRALGLPRVAPFTLVALGGPAPPGEPDPARHLPQPPNNHLSYAITWYGLALVLLVIFVVWAVKVPRA